MVCKFSMATLELTPIQIQPRMVILHSENGASNYYLGIYRKVKASKRERLVLTVHSGPLVSSPDNLSRLGRSPMSQVPLCLDFFFFLVATAAFFQSM